jgi:hypothetical protein
MRSVSNLLSEKVPYHFVGQPTILILTMFSIFKADTGRTQKKNCRSKICCNKHVPQAFCISQKSHVTPP